jgi:hypothetical protein
MGMVDRLSARFRERRMRWFLETCRPDRDTLVLDVGGNPGIWNLIPEVRRPRVVYLNLPRAHEDSDDRSRLVFGDGLHLPFADQSFDLVFSNSVIEHVGDAANQARFAAEIRRVARRRYWVQTPNRGFPVEQHLLTPFLHWLPDGLRAAVARRFTIWQFIAKPSALQRQYYVEHFLRDIRLLHRGQMAELFPDATAVAGERMGPLVKSWVAYRV